jgi:DNA replication and repair protein RecF
LRLTKLQLTNFRSFERAEHEFDPSSGTVIRGDNGRGKSNLLESIFFLAVAKSGRGSRDGDVVRWGSDHYTIAAEIDREDDHLKIRIAYDQRSKKKKAFLNGSPLERLSELIGHFNAVLFSPEDVDLVLRDPSERRRLLDILVSQSSTTYLSDLEQYRRILSQRNHLLRSQGHRLLQNASALLPWDRQLSEIGARIVHARVAALNRIHGPLEELYHSISPWDECLTAVYRSPCLRDTVEETTQALVAVMETKRNEETGIGHTLVGPHRDQVVFNLDDRPAHKFGSKGQMKSVLLAWKLSEAKFLNERTGSKPVLLMDDIFSELDSKRANAVLNMIGEYGQNILATARDTDLDLTERGYEIIDL